MAPKHDFLITYQVPKKTPSTSVLPTPSDAGTLPSQGYLDHKKRPALGPYHEPVDGVPEETQKGTDVPYDLGDLALGTNDRSHQSEGKRMCKATEGNILKWPRIPKWLEFDGSNARIDQLPARGAGGSGRVTCCTCVLGRGATISVPVE